MLFGRLYHHHFSSSFRNHHCYPYPYIHITTHIKIIVITFITIDIFQDGEKQRTDDCSQLLECFYGRLTVTDMLCAANMHCQNKACLCDEKYRPQRTRSDGLILSCMRKYHVQVEDCDVEIKCENIGG